MSMNRNHLDECESCAVRKRTLYFLTPALHYGRLYSRGIRRMIRRKDRAVFRLTEHAERLPLSARVFGFRELPWTTAEVAEARKQTVKANGYKDWLYRALLFI